MGHYRAEEIASQWPPPLLRDQAAFRKRSCHISNELSLSVISVAPFSGGLKDLPGLFPAGSNWLLLGVYHKEPEWPSLLNRQQ